MTKNHLPKSFNDLIRQADKPVLVDFWAEWCAPCRMVSPLIEKLASEYKTELMAIKVNIDKKQHIAAQYQISGIPTIMMFHHGTPVMRLTGALPYEQLKNNIENALKKTR